MQTILNNIYPVLPNSRFLLNIQQFLDMLLFLFYYEFEIIIKKKYLNNKQDMFNLL